MQDIIEDFYGLSSAPFRLTPDPRFFVDTSVHRKALNYLNFGLEQGEGFIVITGEIGAGKSLIIEHMLAEVDQTRIVARTLVTSAVEADEALKLIVSAF
ncbi:MAG: ATPase, partial [Tistlia sp.]